ncbi:MAG: PQQ-binding-like beta-propeller repeat protein [Candidatus Marinimicrobia bacterium]|nr:PQQ-binding-like beta-propeller repeat protein [Candidatus Neomarinimicrobiota bacterium]MCF7829428.1 PQQ-binding-like beta-propeller repeat protein [Candidatus Neomarinimicrobiota bacterium]MCF7880914.1 PQQ-binding-like beta-propeller repeat protein [Candidatus Neomarinimicrobiota bacterium]
MVTRAIHIPASLILVLILLFSCEVRDWNNPYDSGNFIGVKSPLNLDITQVDVHTVRLSWEEQQTHIAGYKIDRKLGDDGDWILAYGKTDSTSWVDTAAVTSNVNYYRVYVYADENESLPLVLSLNPSFPKPAEFQVTQKTDTEIKLSWEDESDGEEGFRIGRKIGDGEWQTHYAIAVENTETWTDTKILLDTTLTYRIQGYAGGNFSGEETKDIKPTFPAPKDLSVEVLDDYRLKLHWQDIYTYETGFGIYRSVNGGTYDFLAEIPSNSESYVDSNLTVGYDYVYRLHAITAENQSHPAVTKSKQTYLPPPGNVEISSDDPYSVHLAWEAVDLPYVTEYQVERKEENGPYIVRGKTSHLEFSDGDITQNNQYTYRVRTVTAHNVSQSSKVHTIIWGEYYDEHWNGSHSDNVISVAMSDDHQWIASGGQENSIKLWDRSDGTLVWSGTQSGPVNVLDFGGLSGTVISGGYGGQVVSWDAASGTQNWTDQHTGVVWDVDIAADNTRLVTGSQDNSLKVWDITTGTELWAGHHSDDVRSVQFTADGSAVVSAGSGGSVVMWNAATGAEVWDKEIGSPLNSVNIDPDQAYVLVGSDRGITVLDYDTGDIIWKQSCGPVMEIVNAFDAPTVLASGPDIDLSAWDSETGAKIWQIDPGKSITTLMAAQTTERVVTGSEDGNVTVWNTNTGDLLWSDTNAEKLWAVSIADDATWIVSGGYDNQIKCWERKFGWILKQ